MPKLTTQELSALINGEGDYPTHKKMMQGSNGYFNKQCADFVEKYHLPPNCIHELKENLPGNPNLVFDFKNGRISSPEGVELYKC